VLASYLIAGALLLALLGLYRRAKRRQLALATLLEETAGIDTEARARIGMRTDDGHRE